jgi:tetratricopeptide (TPR) repeat protein
VHALAAQAFLFCGEYDLADRHSEEATVLNPNDADALYRRAHVLTYLGNPVGALLYMNRALRLDPLMHRGHREVLFDAHYMARDYGSALKVYREWPNPPIHMLAEKAACCAEMGLHDKAQEAAAEFKTKRPSSFDPQAYIRMHVG